MEPQNRLNDVPSLVKLAILKNLDIGSVKPLTTAFDDFGIIYHRCQSPINYAILVKSLPAHILPLAIALHAAKHTDWKAQWPLPAPEELLGNVHRFGRRYLIPNGESAINKDNVSYDMVSDMVTFHSIVEVWASKYLDWAMRNAYTTNEKRSLATRPTTTETARIHAALYTLEIFRQLLPFKIDQNEIFERPFDMLWHYFSPWENKIAGSVDEFLYEMVYNKVKSLNPQARMSSHEYCGSPSSLIGRWITKYGLACLAGLDNDGSQLRSYDDLRNEFDELREDESNELNEDESNELNEDESDELSEYESDEPNEYESDEPNEEPTFRSVCHCINDWEGGSWLRRNEDDINVRYSDIGHVLARFPQEENGPASGWFYTVFYEIEDAELNEHYITWWDRARINTIFPNMVPSMEEMRVQTEGVEYDASAFTLDTDPDWCREVGY